MKQPQLWLWSRQSGRGKSTLLTQLSTMLRLYHITRDDWDDEYEDGQFDLIVADEYRGCKDIAWINQVAEGTRVKLKRKNCTATLKTDRLPMLICSNLPIYEAYDKYKGSDVELIEVRFDQVEVDDNGLIRIDFEGCDVNNL